MDPLLFVATIASPLTGVLGAWLGFKLGRARREAETTPPYVCACGDSLATHDPGTGHCHQMHVRKNVYSPAGEYIGNQLVQCGCRRYVGEFPVDQVDWAAVSLPSPENNPGS